MKRFFKCLILASYAILPCAFALTTYESFESEEHPHAKVLSPEEEVRYFEEARRKGDWSLLDFRFDQTHWRECTHLVTGNYTGIRCANRRGMAVILKDFMDNYMECCVDQALQSNNMGSLDSLHIIHDGILGDRRHSPRSLHAENRAIDIRAFRVTLNDGLVKTLNFRDRANRAFYNEFRKCWGKVINTQNGCPAYGGNIARTGSIGWEDRNHQNHMHTSVPFCVAGDYGSYYYRR